MSANRLYSVFLMLLMPFLALAQKPEEVIFYLDQEPILKSEFEYIYKKNNSRSEKLFSKEDVDEYLELYINFKLKVREARAAGLDTMASFKKEYENYRGQLAQPYLNDKKVTETLIKEGYNRLNQEVRAEHILIQVSPDAFPSDTMAAYKKAMAAREKILGGADFGEVATEMSEDPSVKSNKGDLGYFTAFQMIYPFEDACYSMKVGELSKPIRTRFGYHIIKVADKRPYQGEITVSHLLIRSFEDEDEAKKAIAQSRIDSVYNKLNNGAKWVDLVASYSEDYSTASKGGRLRAFNAFATWLPQSIIDEAFLLKEDKAYSKPFKTKYGWHIVRRESLKPLETYEEMEEIIRGKVSRDSRSQKSKRSAIDRIKKENRFKSYAKNLKHLKPYIDSSLISGEWKAPEQLNKDAKLFRIMKESYLISDFAKYLQENQESGKFSNLDYAVDTYFERYIDQVVIDYEDKNLERKYVDFRNIAKEYEEGILLFEITDQLVWSKAVKDTTGLEAYYEANKDKYMWKERADAHIFYCSNADVCKEVRSKLADDNSNVDDLFKAINKNNSINFSYSKGVFERGENEYVDKVPWKQGFQIIGQNGDRDIMVKINEVLKPEPKKLTEIRGIVIADYQDYLEKEWIKKLRDKYKVKVQQEVVQSLYN